MPVFFGESERRICSMFTPGTRFTYCGRGYTVVCAGKPTCQYGEPKTDIYVASKTSNGMTKEFKISFKQRNADFLENKTNAERAEQLFGSDWQQIITHATTFLQREFQSRPLVYKTRYRHTSAGAITLGWKFELLNRKSGELSGDMHLTKAQVIDVYSGTNLSNDKKNAMVNGRTIRNSGVANYILFENDQLTSAQEVVDSLIAIDDYVAQHPNVFFACKALNYRTREGKYDGNRPLAVYVDRRAQIGKLVSTLVVDSPLSYRGDGAYRKLASAMNALNVRTTNDLNRSNVLDVSSFWDR